MADEGTPGGEWGRHAAAERKSGAGRARGLGLVFLVLFILALAGDSGIGWIGCAFAGTGGRDGLDCVARWVGGHYLVYVAAAVVAALALVAVARSKE